MRVSVVVHGEDAAARELWQMGERATHAQPVLGLVAQMLEATQQRNFRGEGSEFGPWPVLAPGTLADKTNTRPLVATGALERSLSGGASSVRRITDDSVTVGTSIFYARFQHGKRPLVGITARDATVAAEMVARYVEDGLV
jgi:phage gpG-like protein